MKTQLTYNTIIPKYMVFFVASILFLVSGTSVHAQINYSFDGGDYGYNTTSYNTYEPITYSYDGGDYGYNYTSSNTYEPITYSYDGGDYGYNYTTSNTYEPITYSYDGGDYGYNYTSSNTYEPITYSYDGGDYGYNYTSSNTYEPITYSYDGGDYGQVAYTPAPYESYDNEPYTPYTYTNDYNYDYTPYTTYSLNDYVYTPYTYGGGNYSTPYTYGSTNYTYTPYTYPSTNYTYTTTNYDRDRADCDSFTVSNTQVKDGDYVTLRWRTTDADRVSINQGIGNVDDDGEKRIRVTGDTTYTLTARNGSAIDTCTVRVHVERERDVNNKNVQCDSFTISDTRVKDGDYVTLKWRTTDADRVSINQGIGNVDDDGEKRIHVTDDTTYVLTARNGNDSDTCRVNVAVDEKDDTDKTLPRCVLHISDTRITSGQKVTLSWENLRTDRMILKDSYGKEIADSKDNRDIDEDKDSIVVRPTKSTDYTLTVYKGNIKRTCSVGVNIEKQQVSVTSVRTQGSIPLITTPYTGFEAGPTLTAIFYIVLGLWGVAVGYALVLKKSAVVVASHAVGAAIMAPKVTTSPVVETHTLVMPDFPTNLPTDDSVLRDGMSTEVVSDEGATRTLEAHAHEQYALFSSDALRYIENQSTTLEGQVETLDRVIGLAKARFPKEGDWIVINKERVLSLLA